MSVTLGSPRGSCLTLSPPRSSQSSEVNTQPHSALPGCAALTWLSPSLCVSESQSQGSGTQWVLRQSSGWWEQAIRPRKQTARQTACAFATRTLSNHESTYSTWIKKISTSAKGHQMGSQCPASHPSPGSHCPADPSISAFWCLRLLLSFKSIHTYHSQADTTNFCLISFMNKSILTWVKNQFEIHGETLPLIQESVRPAPAP